MLEAQKAQLGHRRDRRPPATYRDRERRADATIAVPAGLGNIRESARVKLDDARGPEPQFEGKECPTPGKKGTLTNFAIGKWCVSPFLVDGGGG